MHSLNETTLNCNKSVKISFTGGDLSSDAGLLLIQDFASQIGFTKVAGQMFHTTDPALFRRHTDAANLMQTIYQIIASYGEDDCADELTNEPVFKTILGKEALASQPTLSRFYNRMDEATLSQFTAIGRKMRDIIYSICPPEYILFDIDSTLFNTYGKQEGEAFNYHYQSHGYHPLLCYDGLTGDLLKAELRDGTMYCSNGAAEFMEPLLMEYRERFPEMLIALRGDSGFASPDLYNVCEKYNCKYTIRPKINKTLTALASAKDESLYRATRFNQVDYAVVYGEFMYQAGTWDCPRRVVYKIEKPSNQLTHMYTFVVTNMEDLAPYQVLQLYCGRGKMENFIKEGKGGFDFGAVSSRSRVVNANRLQVHVLAYNLFNWLRRLVLPKSMQKLRVDTIRVKLMKVAARVVHTSRYIHFRLCSSCPYKAQFYETLSNIGKLNPQLE